MQITENMFPTYRRLMDAVRDRMNTTGKAPKSVACGTAAKMGLNFEILQLMNVPNPSGETVVRTLNCGFGDMDLYADTRLPADAMELRDESCGPSCAD
jgi:hypothetical protein